METAGRKARRFSVHMLAKFRRFGVVRDDLRTVLPVIIPDRYGLTAHAG